MAKKKDLSKLDQERLAKVMSDVNEADAFTIVNQDPEYAYYFASKNNNHPQSVGMMEMKGYEPVNSEHNSGERVPMATVQTAEGGAIQNDSHVLMRIPREYAEAHREAVAENARAKRRQLDDKMAEIKDEANFIKRDYDDNRKVFSFSR